MTDFQTLSVERDGQCATISLVPKDRKVFTGTHVEIGRALAELRFDNAIRVIVITGRDGLFFLPPQGSSRARAGAHTPGTDWDVTQGMQNTFLQLLECEKPVLAKVNGDAFGFGSSLIFACDLIVARDDAVICDHHLGMGETSFGGRTDMGLVPGDGGGGVRSPVHDAADGEGIPAAGA